MCQYLLIFAYVAMVFFAGSGSYNLAGHFVSDKQAAEDLDA